MAVEYAEPLSSLPQFGVFRYLSFGQRRYFAKKCPQFRKIHRTFPFYLSKVQFSSAISDGSLIFKLIIDNIRWSASNEFFFFPSGEYMEKRECIDFDEKLISFYLNRKGTQISELYLNICHPFKFTNFYPWKISSLSLTSGRYQSDNGQGSEPFRNLRLKRLDVDAVTYDVFDDFQKLNIRTETLMIWSANSQDLPRLHMIPHEKFVIWDRNFKPVKFSAICKELKNNTIEVKSGSSYGGKSVGRGDRGKLSTDKMIREFSKRNFNIEVYMSALKEVLNAKVKYISGGISGYCATINIDLELFIIVKEIEFDAKNISTYLFEATVQDIGTAMTFRQLSLMDRLRYWNTRKNCWVLGKLTKYITSQRKLTQINLTSVNSSFANTRAHTDEEELSETIMLFSWLKDFHMLFLVVLIQMIVLVIIMSVSLISSNQLLLLFCLFVFLDFLAFNPWDSRNGESVRLQTLCLK